MRINAPQLFNGEILASQKWIADQLSGLFPSGGYIPSAEVFNIGDVLNSDMIIKSVYGDTIKIDSTDAAQTIKEYISTVSGDLYDQITTGVKIGYGLTRNGNGIEVVPSSFISFAKDDEAVSGYAASYTMTIDGKETKINIPKDQFLKDAEFIKAATKEEATAYPEFVTEGKSYIRFTFNISEDGLGDTEKIMYMPADDLFQAYSAGAGLSVAIDGNGTTFSIVKDNASDSKFLTIGDTTIGLSGITDAINAASGYALYEANAHTDLASGALLGTADDTDAANTIYGAKAYADKVAGEAKTAASDALNTFITGTYDPFVAGTNADIDIISGVISENYANESTIDDRLTAVETTVGIGSGTGSLTDRMTKAEADIDAVEAEIADIRTKAVEFFQTTVPFGGATSGTVEGRVIAVFDSTGAQCYPTITYVAGTNILNGTSTLTAATKDNAVENFTVIHSIFITPLTGTVTE